MMSGGAGSHPSPNVVGALLRPAPGIVRRRAVIDELVIAIGCLLLDSGTYDRGRPIYPLSHWLPTETQAGLSSA